MSANGRLYVIEVFFRIPVDGTEFMIRADAAARCSLRRYSVCMAHFYLFLSVYISFQRWLAACACLICPSHGVLWFEARISDSATQLRIYTSILSERYNRGQEH